LVAVFLGFGDARLFRPMKLLVTRGLRRHEQLIGAKPTNLTCGGDSVQLAARSALCRKSQQNN